MTNGKSIEERINDEIIIFEAKASIYYRDAMGLYDVMNDATKRGIGNADGLAHDEKHVGSLVDIAKKIAALVNFANQYRIRADDLRRILDGRDPTVRDVVSL